MQYEIAPKLLGCDFGAKMAYSRQESYVDNRERDLEFEAGDCVYLEISPMKGEMMFGKKEKHGPRYVGP